MRISCPDATGLGVDLMRVLLDFGLRIIRADISTDGTWCFLVLVVTLSSGVPPRWNLLKSRLQEICPADSEALRNLVRTTSRELQQPFTVHVSGYDRQGMLHALTHSLWEADTSVFKAHVTTDAAGEALDVFWLYDNRNELPQPHRVLEICDRIKGALGPDVKCLVQAAPRTGDPYDSFEGSGHILPRLPCKDALSSRNLRAIVERKAENSGSGTGSGYGSSNDLSASDEPAPLYSPLSPFSAAATADVAVDVDNTTSSSYTMITLRCQDRKGLLYDLFLKLKEVDVRVAYGRVAVDPAEGTSTVELFVQDVGGGRITDEELLRELTGRLRTAAALPVRIEVHDVMSGAATELTVAAPVDAGHRGRPRVTFDVTQGLSSAGVGVYSADGEA